MTKPKATGYWLFALDCKAYTEDILSEPIDILTTNYIASNMWPDLSVRMKSTYKMQAKNLNGLGIKAKAPQTIDKAEFMHLSEKFKVAHVWKHHTTGYI